METRGTADRGEGCLAGGGEMSRLMRAYDWSATPLGPVSGWPRSVQAAVRIVLGSRFPMFVWWGRELLNFYNDAYAPMLGARHRRQPGALGRPALEAWADIWPVVGPLAETVLNEGRSTWNEELLLIMERYGYAEEAYFTFSYSPCPGDDGGIGGVFCAVIEDTQRVLDRRRMRTLREVAAKTLGARSVEDACRAAAEAIGENPHDLPFALIYLLDAEGQTARLACASGLAEGSPACPETIPAAPADDAPTAWPLGRVLATGEPQLVDDLLATFGPLRCGVWPEPPRAALALPVWQPGLERPAGVLVAGISPRRAFDDEYRGFFDLLAGNAGTAITNARAYEEERRRAEALAELDRAKTAFFSNVSHEFRTPLTLMLGPVEELLGRPDRLDPDDRRLLGLAHRNALRLQKLVNTLLDFSRIEAGRGQASFEPTDLAALTADLASNFRSACERAGLDLVVDCQALPEPVFVDREMWEKIVLNLLSNALKYTLEGRVEVRLRAEAGRVELGVRDTGTGIPPGEMPRLFERFHRVAGARGRTQEGSGIGLALVRELVGLHGGEVRAESVPGKGSAFLVSIPLGSSHLPAERIGAPRTLASTALGVAPYVEEALRWLPDEAAGELPPVVEPIDAPAAGPRPDGSTTRILLADDNADMRRYVCHLLNGRYQVEAVSDGTTALAAARRRPPDLILADVMMPGLDGFGLLRELRADPRTREVPVLLLSARAGEEARVEGLKAGADDYITKPFGARELLARVASQLELARLRRQAEQERRRGDERSRAILESITDAFVAVDADWRFTYVNGQAERIYGMRRDDLIGRSYWDVFPDVIGSMFEAPYRRAMAQREPLRIDGPYEPLGGWFEVKAFPIEGGGLSFYFRDVSEQRRAEEALREADRRKDEFLATLAHELRNPLAPIRTALHLMREPAAGGHEEDRAMAERQVVHLARLIDDLMDVARISRGKLELHREVVELHTIVRQAVETARPQIDDRRHELTVSLPEGPIRLEADPTRLEQVFWNLLNNSAKYTPPGGRIDLFAAQEGDEVAVRVRDSGVGIEPAMLSRLFQMFVQLGEHREHAQGGLGIGLGLVRSLVDLHGGTIEAHSAGPGTGSEFVVRLPVLPAATAEAVPRGPDRRQEADAEAALPRLRILIVDDNVDAAAVLARMLGRIHGQQVEVAQDGPSALEVAEAFRPEVVLLDIGLPGMDGHEVARRLRSRPEFARIPLVALTGWGQEADRVRSREAGFDHHLVKPVDPNDLVDLLRKVARPGPFKR